MLISVIIPTINRTDVLQRAVDSVVAAAKYQKLDAGMVELIVVNDTEEDVNLNVSNSELVHIKVIASSGAPFGGPSLARHTGILNSSSDLIFFLDDDDYFLPNRFKYCLEIYQSNSDVDAVLEPSIRKDVATGYEFKAGARTDVDDGFRWMLAGDQSCHIATGATSFRRSSYYDVGGMDLNLKHGEDGELLLRLCYYKNIKFTYTDMVVVCERHDDNSSHESKRRHYQNMNALESLYKNTRSLPEIHRDDILKPFIQAKFSYLLSRCISRYSYPKRVYEVLFVAYFFPWRWANKNTYKSLLVAIFKFYYR